MTADRTAPTPHANVIDRTGAPTEVFEAARDRWEAREAVDAAEDARGDINSWSIGDTRTHRCDLCDGRKVIDIAAVRAAAPQPTDRQEQDRG